ncbi:MAG: Sulfotransferase family protein [Marmoricola sp.]|nr:Sulfotransferase family protein [Marmoricola sp.]
MPELTTGPGGNLLEAFRAVPGSYKRAFLAVDRKIMFISVNKNACTSLKWMMADLAGEDLSAFDAGLMPYADDEEAVHTRRQWKVSPRMFEVDPEVRASIHPDNGWFVFGVTRDPRLRFFSAWQNKMLLDSPVTTALRQEPWYPRHPATEQSIIEDFATFTEFMEQTPEHRLRATDAHFRPQANLLMHGAIPYTKIYDLTEMGQLKRDLGAHLEGLGLARELYLPRSNNTPLHASGALFANGVRESIERMYARDFELFGDRWDFSTTLASPGWSETELEEVEMVARLSRRIGDVRDLGIAYRLKAEDLERQVAVLTAPRPSLLRRLRSRAGRIRRALQR